jgi:hypothetical protein
MEMNKKFEDVLIIGILIISIVGGYVSGCLLSDILRYDLTYTSIGKKQVLLDADRGVPEAIEIVDRYAKNGHDLTSNIAPVNNPTTWAIDGWTLLAIVVNTTIIFIVLRTLYNDNINKKRRNNQYRF